jgi:general stress protein 26
MSDLKKKILELLSTPQMVSFSTITEDGSPWVRYVVGAVDEALHFVFCTFTDSRKVAQIEADPRVHIAAGGKGLEETQTYVQYAGLADMTRDEDLRHAVWHDGLETYFEGPDDPNFCVVVVTPTRIEVMGMTGMTPEVWEP